MKLLAVLLLSCFSIASPLLSLNDDILNDHAHNFLSFRSKHTVNEVFDNIEATELVRSLTFCSRNNVDTIGPCMATNFREGKAAPRMMNRFVQKALKKVGQNITVQIDLSEDGTIKPYHGPDGDGHTWTFRGTASCDGQTVSYLREGSFINYLGSQFLEKISSSGDDYRANTSYAVHVGCGSVPNTTVVSFECMVSVNMYAVLRTRNVDADYVGLAILYAKIRGVNDGHTAHMTTPTTVSYTAEDTVTISESDGSVKHFGESVSEGSNIEAELNVTQTESLVQISTSGDITALATHFSDHPDYRYDSSGSVWSTASVTLDNGKVMVTGQEATYLRETISDYEGNLLATVQSDTESVATIDVVTDNRSTDLKGSGHFSSSVKATCKDGQAVSDSEDQGTFTGTVTLTNNDDGTMSGHSELHLTVNVHKE